MLRSGVSCGPQYDKKALADILVRIGHLVSQHPEIKEMDLNPVRVFEKGVLVLDALMLVDQHDITHLGRIPSFSLQG